MYYKITVEEIALLEEGERYPKENKIYEQIIEDLDVLAVINAVNKQARDIKELI